MLAGAMDRLDEVVVEEEDLVDEELEVDERENVIVVLVEVLEYSSTVEEEDVVVEVLV